MFIFHWFKNNKRERQMDKIRVLFVCMGNICRSPAAEGILKNMAEKEKLEDKLEIDSAGTIDYHTGESPDPRMKFHAADRGYFLKSKARQFDPPTDFEKFDYIIAMDDQIFSEIQDLDKKHIYQNKIHKMVEYSRYVDVDEVPDPYMGGAEGFEKVLEILVDTCRGLLNRLKNELKPEN
jgi:low molecular weight protein-tyrosine phosphatase